MRNDILQRVGPATMGQTLRFLRITHGCLMISIGLYTFAMRMVPPQTLTLQNPNLPMIFAVLAAVSIGLAFYFRSRFLGSAFDTLRLRPDDPAALKSWRQGVLTSDVLIESVALYGFALCFIGGQVWQAVTFMVVGELLMVLWWPRQPE